MEGWQKLVLFIATLGATLITVWFLIPAFMDIWLETATRTSTYGLGFILGFVVCLIWVVVIYRWNEY